MAQGDEIVIDDLDIVGAPSPADSTSSQSGEIVLDDLDLSPQIQGSVPVFKKKSGESPEMEKERKRKWIQLTHERSVAMEPLKKAWEEQDWQKAHPIAGPAYSALAGAQTTLTGIPSLALDINRAMAESENPLVKYNPLLGLSAKSNEILASSVEGAFPRLPTREDIQATHAELSRAAAENPAFGAMGMAAPIVLTGGTSGSVEGGITGLNALKAAAAARSLTPLAEATPLLVQTGKEMGKAGLINVGIGAGVRTATEGTPIPLEKEAWKLSESNPLTDFLVGVPFGTNPVLAKKHFHKKLESVLGDKTDFIIGKEIGSPVVKAKESGWLGLKKTKSDPSGVVEFADIDNVLTPMEQQHLKSAVPPMRERGPGLMKQNEGANRAFVEIFRNNPSESGSIVGVNKSAREVSESLQSTIESRINSIPHNPVPAKSISDELLSGINPNRPGEADDLLKNSAANYTNKELTYADLNQNATDINIALRKYYPSEGSVGAVQDATFHALQAELKAVRKAQSNILDSVGDPEITRLRKIQGDVLSFQKRTDKLEKDLQSALTKIADAEEKMSGSKRSKLANLSLGAMSMLRDASNPAALYVTIKSIGSLLKGDKVFNRFIEAEKELNKLQKSLQKRTKFDSEITIPPTPDYGPVYPKGISKEFLEKEAKRQAEVLGLSKAEAERAGINPSTAAGQAESLGLIGSGISPNPATRVPGLQGIEKLIGTPSPMPPIINEAPLFRQDLPESIKMLMRERGMPISPVSESLPPGYVPPI